MNANQSEDNSFAAQCLALGRLETFAPIAFQGNETTPQAVCAFVLALALAFNDLKDVSYAHIVLQDYKPDETANRRTRAFGLYGGMNMHLLRLIMGTLHELFRLIESQEDVIQDAAFRKTVRLLPPQSRDAWDDVVNVAMNRETKTAIGKMLVRVRNHVAFHYDPKRIQSGYNRHFLSSQKEDDRAYISRGDSMKGTRYYFADAAAYGLLRNELGTRPEDMIMDLMDTVTRTYLKIA